MGRDIWEECGTAGKKEEEKRTNKTSITGIWENSTVEIYKQVEREVSGEARGTSIRIFEESRIMWLHMIQNAKVNKETAEENNKKKQSDKKTWERRKDFNEENDRKKEVIGKQMTEDTTTIKDDEEKQMLRFCKKMKKTQQNDTTRDQWCNK